MLPCWSYLILGRELRDQVGEAGHLDVAVLVLPYPRARVARPGRRGRASGCCRAGPTLSSGESCATRSARPGTRMLPCWSYLLLGREWRDQVGEAGHEDVAVLVLPSPR